MPKELVDVMWLGLAYLALTLLYPHKIFIKLRKNLKTQKQFALSPHAQQFEEEPPNTIGTKPSNQPPAEAAKHAIPILLFPKI